MGRELPPPGRRDEGRPLRVDFSQQTELRGTTGTGAPLPLAVVSAKDRSLRPEQPVIRERRRLRGGALGGEAPHRNPELPRLVGEVGGDARAGESDETGGQRFEHLIVALEGRRLGVLGPVGLEDNLRDLVVIGPTGGDALGALGLPPCSSTMSGCLARALSSTAQMR